MTVDDLIAALRTFRGDLEVVVQGYEEGWDPLLKAEVIKVRLIEPKPAAWEGVFQEIAGEGEGQEVLALRIY